MDKGIHGNSDVESRAVGWGNIVRNSGALISDGDIEDRVRKSTGITEFQRKVYLELLKVPAGETVTYGELALRVGCRSARAIGQALRRNPFAPDVPCHRVIAANSGIGGYFGQIDGPLVERKRALLAAEKASALSGKDDIAHHCLSETSSPR